MGSKGGSIESKHILAFFVVVVVIIIIHTVFTSIHDDAPSVYVIDVDVTSTIATRRAGIVGQGKATDATTVHVSIFDTTTTKTDLVIVLLLVSPLSIIHLSGPRQARTRCWYWYPNDFTTLNPIATAIAVTVLGATSTNSNIPIFVFVFVFDNANSAHTITTTNADLADITVIVFFVDVPFLGSGAGNTGTLYAHVDVAITSNDDLW